MKSPAMSCRGRGTNERHEDKNRFRGHRVGADVGGSKSANDHLPSICLPLAIKEGTGVGRPRRAFLIQA